jgi:hypothetical protein
LDHLNTLRDDNSHKISIGDMMVFYAAPMAIGVAVFYWKPFSLSKDISNASITFFGIFIALLLNIQVAAFNIFQRKWEEPEDSRIREIERQRLDIRRRLLGEINSNISYLIIVSCVALILFVVFLAANTTADTAVGASSSLYSHFMLTLLMVVKRSYALFQGEYLKK